MRSRRPRPPPLDALQEMLPRAMTFALPGLDHGSVQDYGQLDRVAPILGLFFRDAAAALNGAGRTDSLIVVGQEDLRGFQGDNAAHACAPPGTLHGKHPAEHIETILKSE